MLNKSDLALSIWRSKSSGYLRQTDFKIAITLISSTGTEITVSEYMTCSDQNCHSLKGTI